MVEVEKYIKRLLHQHDCVVIPEFGGLLIHYTPAKYDRPNGRFLPATRKVAFNEVLKMDDGLLVQSIVVGEGISRPSAQQCVRDFVATATSLIRKNKVISINGIGKFHLNEENRLQFQPELNRNFHTEYFGLDVLAVKPVNRNASLQIVDEEEVNYPVVQPMARKSMNWFNWLSAATIAGLLVYVSAVLSNKPEVTMSNLNPFTFISSLFEEHRLATEEKTLIIPSNKSVSAEEISSKVEEIEEATAPVEENVEPVVSPVVAETKTYPFHVIAAVYETKSALEKYGSKLKAVSEQKGFTEVTTIRVQDRYMLSVGGFDSWNEASKNLPAVKKSVSGGAWIYKKR